MRRLFCILLALLLTSNRVVSQQPKPKPASTLTFSPTLAPTAEPTEPNYEPELSPGTGPVIDPAFASGSSDFLVETEVRNLTCPNACEANSDPQNFHGASYVSLHCVGPFVDYCYNSTQSGMFSCESIGDGTSNVTAACIPGAAIGRSDYAAVKRVCNYDGRVIDYIYLDTGCLEFVRENLNYFAAPLGDDCYCPGGHTPTSLPSGQPSSQPSGLPSSLPSGQPSERPSSRPSATPTGQPSSTPSSRPTSHPTSVPSGEPSAQPSNIPTGQPTAQPSSFPSDQPTGRPSAQPTMQPTSLPSSQPSSAPTSIPSAQPTSLPSGQPSCQPTVVPTAAPSWEVDDYEGSPLYSKFVRTLNYTAQNHSDLNAFGTFMYKGTFPQGTCDAWETFYSSDLLLPFDDMFIAGITVSFQYLHIPARDREENVSSSIVKKKCVDRTEIKNIVDALNRGYNYNSTCGGESIWSVFGCQGNMGLCIDCDVTEQQLNATFCAIPSYSICAANTTNILTGDVNGGIVINPCGACENEYHDAYATLGLTLGEDILYPQFRDTVELTPNDTTIGVGFNVSSSGTVYCAAFAHGHTPVSVVEVISRGMYAIAAESGVGNLTLAYLIPSTEYTVYCYTEDFADHRMDLLAVLNTAVNVTTSCCRGIKYTTFVPKRFNDSIDEYTLTLDSLPPENMNFSIVVTPTYPCDFNETSLRPAARAILRSPLLFGPSSLSPQRDFIILGTPGCYDVSVSAVGSGRAMYEDVSATVILQSHKSNADAPKMTSAQFGRNPQRVVVSFDSATDRGVNSGVVSNPLQLFPCENIFESFAGSHYSECLWKTDKATRVDRVTIFLSRKGDPDGSNTEIGTQIQLKNNVLEPCAECCPLSNQACDMAAQHSVLTEAPEVPIDVTAALSTSSEIGECADIILDPSQSSGDGGRTWSDVLWSVEAYRDGSAMTTVSASVAQFLNNGYASTRRAIIIQNSLLQDPSGLGTEYIFTLILRNFLGQSSQMKRKVLVRSIAKVPRVSIDGVSTRSIYRSNKLSLFARASVPKCAGDTSTLVDQLEYSWRVFIGARYIPILESTSKDPRQFKLDGYSLDSNRVYTINVKTSLNGGVSSTASVAVEVKSAGVIAAILGGIKRSASTSSDVMFISSSYDIDYPTDYSDLAYTWTCEELTPNYGDACPSSLVASLDTSGSGIATIPANTFTRSADVTYSITLRVEKLSSGDVDSITIEVLMVTTAIPEIAFSAVEPKYNSMDKIILSATVTTIDVATITWSCEDFSSAELGTMILTPLGNQVPTGVSIAELALMPNALVAGASYTFVLQSQYLSSSTMKYEEVDIAINSAPSGGSLEITPATGTTMETEFYFSTFDWQDDPEDYPLTYIIYTSPDDDIAIASVIKNANEATYVYAQVEQGLDERNYNVTAFIEAVDSLGATDVARNYVIVQPEPDPNKLETSMDTALDDAFANQDPEAVSQVISAVSASMNAVDCNVAVACASINRASCKNTHQTCGECLNGYVGVYGDSNEACGLESNVKPIGDACTSDNECVSEICLLSTTSLCGPFPNKPCIANCSNIGTCSFYSHLLDGMQISSCPQDDRSCYQECSCPPTWYGQDCSLPLRNMTRAQRMRESMCASIYRTVSIQDATSDVVQSRCSSLNKLLLNSEQLTNFAVVNCTLALLDTISFSPSIVGKSGISDLVSEALSAVLKLDLEPALLKKVSLSLETLVDSVRDQMAVGEPQQTFNTDNLRVGAQIVDASSNILDTFSPPQYTDETFNRRSISSLKINSAGDGSAAALGVSVIQYNNNPMEVSTDTTPFGVQIGVYDASSRTSTSTSTSTSSTTTIEIVLINSDVKSYFERIPESRGRLSCDSSLKSAENVTANCPMRDLTSFALYFESIVLNCPPNSYEFLDYTCPEFDSKPKCLIYNDIAADFVEDLSLCTVKSFTKWNTTCTCIVTSESAASRRRLGTTQTSSSGMLLYSSSASNTGSTISNAAGANNAPAPTAAPTKAGQARDDDTPSNDDDDGEQIIKDAFGSDTDIALVAAIASSGFILMAVAAYVVYIKKYPRKMNTIAPDPEDDTAETSSKMSKESSKRSSKKTSVKFNSIMPEREPGPDPLFESGSGSGRGDASKRTGKVQPLVDAFAWAFEDSDDDSVDSHIY